MSAHGDWSVQVDPEIPGDSNWLHQRAADSNRLGRDLMLAMCGRAPENLGLAMIELQPVIGHDDTAYSHWIQ